jgi:hypothetical protein
VVVAQRTGREKDVPEVLLRLAQAETGMNSHREAARHVTEARLRIATVSDPVMHARLQADLADTESDLRNDNRPSNAITELTRTLDHFRLHHNYPGLVRAYLRRSSAYLRNSQPDSAEIDLASAIELIEGGLSSTTSATLRASLLESVVGVYDDMIRLMLATGRHAAAFGYLERSRATRSQLFFATATTGDSFKKASIDTPSLQSLADSVPTSTAAVIYGVLDNQLLAWGLSAGQVRFHTTTIKAVDLNNEITRFVSLLNAESDTAVTKRASFRLFNLLFGAFGDQLASASEIVIVPDKLLYQVPYAALYDSSRRRYLIEHADISILPSAHQLERRRVFTAATKPIIVGGAPSNSLPGFTALPGAEREVEEVAKLYPAARVVSGRTLTRRNLLARIPTHRMMHFAGHARFNPTNPAQSFVVLSGETGLKLH